MARSLTLSGILVWVVIFNCKYFLVIPTDIICIEQGLEYAEGVKAKKENIELWELLDMVDFSSFFLNVSDLIGF